MNILAGKSGRDIFSGVEDDLEEAIVVITREDVRLYAPRSLWARLLPRLGLWQRLRLWMPSEAMEADMELLEEHKARSFVQMVHSLPSLALAIPAKAV